MFDVKFTKSATKDLNKLPKDIQKRIIKKLKFFAVQKDPLVFAKPLADLPPMTHRFRVGNYRVAFYIDSKAIYVDRIKHRREVYLS
ncbi:MAG TPA: type II toxin-antitoxin system RelE/ParE family toxin [Xanthomonadales bacterium]|nr:type II toxin-antitoxin system RelE/ParE family toxin [Xanthomonadales bacterium]